jgi:prepilin peptidase CpaA
MPALDTTTSCLLVLLAASAWFDATERRIPNALTVGGLLLALSLAARTGLSGLGAAASGAAIAFAIALPLFLIGGLGGGDVKLLTATGAFLGPAELPTALVAIALVGGVMAVIEVVRQGAVRRTLVNLWLVLASLRPSSFNRWRARGSGEALTINAPEAVTVPFAIAVALGVLATRVMQ